MGQSVLNWQSVWAVPPPPPLKKTSRKRHLKSELALPQTLSRLFHIMFSSTVGKSFCSWILKVSKSTSSTKREVRHFYVVVAQRRQRNVQKNVMHVQSCCYANLNRLLFCRPRCLLKLPTVFKRSWEDCVFARTITYAKFKGQTVYYKAFEKDNTLSIPGVV